MAYGVPIKSAKSLRKAASGRAGQFQINEKENVWAVSNLKSNKLYRDYIRPERLDVFMKAITAARCELGLDTEKTRIVFKPIRISKGSPSGVWFDGVFTAIIDPRHSLAGVVNIIGHELMHAQQYVQGRLIYNSGSLPVYNGAVYHAKIGEYETLPWEVEAYAYGKKFAAEFMARQTALVPVKFVPVNLAALYQNSYSLAA